MFFSTDEMQLLLAKREELARKIDEGTLSGNESGEEIDFSDEFHGSDSRVTRLVRSKTPTTDIAGEFLF